MTFPLMRIDSGESQKSRVFTVRRLAYLRADRLWEPRKGKASEVQPAFLAFLGSRAACQAFCANLMAERHALCEGETFSVSKKAGYRWMHQEVPGGVVTSVYLPQLFHLEPVEDPGWVRFVFAPPRWWVEAQAVELRLEVAGIEGASASGGRDAAEAALFAAFLDRRTPVPILRELRFQLQLYRAAQEAGFVTSARNAYSGFDFAGFTECGLRAPLAIAASHESLTAFLKEQINTYRETYHGKTASPAGGRLLSYPEAPSFQYCLFDQVAQ